LGPVKFRRIYEVHGSFSTFWETVSKSEYSFLGRQDLFGKKFHEHFMKEVKALKNMLEDSRNFILEQVNMAKISNGKLISYFDKEYPPNLYKSNQCVPVLYAAGNTNILKTVKCCAVIGTREPSEWSRRETETAVGELSKHGYVVVSGLAKGVDTIAHEAVLANKAKTIAVMGCGVDVYYPKENQRLQDEIRKKGVIVSEYPFGSKIQAISLQKRNKIIVGISEWALIAETSRKGGTMNAYRAAIEQKKPIGVFLPSSKVGGDFDGNMEIALKKKTKVYCFSEGRSINIWSK